MTLERQRRARALVALAAAALALPAAACSESKAKVAPPPPTVIVAPVARRDVALYTEAVGGLDGYVNAEIRARVRGLLRAQKYPDGAAGKQGQLLFSADRPEFPAGRDSGRGRRGP